MSVEKLKAPFPYFGGKTLIAEKVWGLLGQPEHYLEPFFGSGAVLLNRPNWNPDMTETINDKDCNIANVWRAMKYAPVELAEVCDYPVSHIDIAARRLYLINAQNNLKTNMLNDPEFYDIKLAGYWIYCTCLWIGGRMMTPRKNENTIGKRPPCGDKGIDINSIGKIPFLTCKGQSINMVNVNIREWFTALQNRLRKVRICNGDWSCILGGNWQDKTWDTVGIFLDPPYSHANRDSVYKEEDFSIAHKVREYCKKRSEEPNWRIVLAGYEGEHNELEEIGWGKIEWKPNGGMGNCSGNKGSRGQDNAKLERLWYSPHCKNNADDLFGGAL